MQQRLRAIVVDDEESARNILYNLLQNHKSDIEVISLCENVEQAVVQIKNLKPDVVFLDIEMPNYSGLELVSFFNYVFFDIVFVTAYQNFAVKAFEIAAFDYLLKPIELSRLENTIANLKEKRNKEIDALNYQVLKESLSHKKVQKMVVQHLGAQKALHFSDVIAIEANESYSIIHEIGGMQYTMSKNLKYFETLLEENSEFMRVHKSWIVNYHHILKYSNADYSIYLSNNILAKLSKYKKAEFDIWYKG